MATPLLSAGELNNKAVSAVKWASVGTVIKFAIQLIAQVVLTRLLGPQNYGIFAMGMVVLAFSNFLTDFGFSWGLIQNQTINKEDVRFAFTWQVISGSIATVVLYVSAPLIATYFNEAHLEPVVRWLSLGCLISAITVPGSHLLRRNLDFKWLNMIQILSYIVGYICIGIPLAFGGAGVWSLVCAWLGQTLCAFVLTLIRSPHPKKWLFWYAGGHSSTKMGSTVFVTNLCNWFLNNLDRIFLGHFLNAHAVGIYSVGYNLATTPNTLFLTALQPAFLATGAKLQGDKERLRGAYLSVIASIWIVIAPMFVLLALVSNDLVAVLYGSKWTSSGLVLSILALSMPAYIMWGMSTPILWNTGGKHLESMLQIPIVGISAILFFLFASHGVLAVAEIAAGTLLLRTVVISTAACKRLGISLTDLMPTVLRGVIILSITAANTWLGGAIGHAIGQGAVMPLIFGIIGGVGTATVVALLYPPLLGMTVVKLLSRFSPPIPKSITSYLQHKCSTK